MRSQDNRNRQKVRFAGKLRNLPLIVVTDSNHRMNQSEFVDALRIAILDGVGAKVVAYWATPPGRLRSESRTARSNWINSLSAENREQAEALADDAAHAALFGMLCILDAARPIENPEDRGHLELYYVKDGTRSLLSSSAHDLPALPLHELL